MAEVLLFINVDDASIGGGKNNNSILFDSNILYRVPAEGDNRTRPKRTFWKSSMDKNSGYINCLYFDAPTPTGVRPGDTLIASFNPDKGTVGLQFGDPLFDKEAMKKRIFRFEPGSPAEKLGIKPLDMSLVGSTLATGGIEQRIGLGATR